MDRFEGFVGAGEGVLSIHEPASSRMREDQLFGNISTIGRFDLLRQLYTTIIIPNDVREEVVTRGAGRPGSHETGTARWIQHVAVADAALVGDSMKELDAGEAAAIACAVKLGDALLLRDEASGRKRAAEFGLVVRGSVGIVLEAKRRGLVVAVRPVLDDLRASGGLFISDAVFVHALAAAGE